MCLLFRELVKAARQRVQPSQRSDECPVVLAVREADDHEAEELARHRPRDVAPGGARSGVSAVPQGWLVAG